MMVTITIALLLLTVLLQTPFTVHWTMGPLKVVGTQAGNYKDSSAGRASEFKVFHSKCRKGSPPPKKKKQPQTCVSVHVCAHVCLLMIAWENEWGLFVSSKDFVVVCFFCYFIKDWKDETRTHRKNKFPPRIMFIVSSVTENEFPHSQANHPCIHSNHVVKKRKKKSYC